MSSAALRTSLHSDWQARARAVQPALDPLRSPHRHGNSPSGPEPFRSSGRPRAGPPGAARGWPASALKRWVSSPKGRAARSCLEVLAFAPTVDAAIVGRCGNSARFEAFFAGVARALRGSSRQQLVTPTCSWAGKPAWWSGGGCVASAARHGRRAGCLAELSRFPSVQVEARVAAVGILVSRVVHRSNALRAFPDG